jgi:hypothetical protein
LAIKPSIGAGYPGHYLKIGINEMNHRLKGSDESLALIPHSISPKSVGSRDYTKVRREKQHLPPANN